jgi:hypothetical protein
VRGSLPIAAAILAGFALVAAALYFRPAAPVVTTGAAVAAAVPGRPATGSASAVAAPADPAAKPAAPPPDASALQARAIAALAPARAQWLETCWAKLTAGQTDPPRSRFRLSLQFDAEGHEVGRGFISPREGTNPAVDACINALPVEPLRLAATGAPFRLELDLQVP